MVVKFLLGCVIISALGLASASPVFERPQYGNDKLKYWNLFVNQKTTDVTNAAYLDENAEMQIDPVITPILISLGIKAGSKVAKYIAKCAICKKCSLFNKGEAELQLYARENEISESNDLFAVLETMVNVNIVEEKLSELMHRLMKDDRVAEAEFFADKISRAIELVKKGARKLGRAAKKALCDDRNKCHRDN